MRRITLAVIAAVLVILPAASASARSLGTIQPVEPDYICRVDRTTGTITCSPVRGINPPSPL